MNAAVVVAMGIVLAGVSAGVSVAAVNGAPSSNGLFFANNGTVFIIAGYVDWTDSFQPAGNNAQLFTATVLLFAVDLSSLNQTLSVSLWEQGYGWSNTSQLLTTHQQTQITLNLHGNPKWTPCKIYMGSTVWSFQAATPYTLLPLSALNLGGLDLLVVTALYEIVALFAVITALARFLQKRALYAREFSLLVWGHVFAFLLVASVLVDYQQIDQTFAGWSPLLYPFAVTPLWWAAMLSHYNKGVSRLYLQAVPKPNSKLGLRLYDLIVAKNRDGDTVACKPSAGGWLARVFGHYTVLERHEELKPESFLAEVEPAAPFEVTNPSRKKTPIAEVGLLRAGSVFRIKWPHLTIHRPKDIPKRTLKDGSIEDAHSKIVLTWPHYTDAEVTRADFASANAAHQLAVASEWTASEFQAEMLTTTEAELFVLKAGVSASIEKGIASRLRTFWAVQEDVANGEVDDIEEEVEGPRSPKREPKSA